MALAWAIPMSILPCVTLWKEKALTLVSAVVVVPIVFVLSYGFGATLYVAIKRIYGPAKDNV
jgi:hypothetical protein